MIDFLLMPKAFSACRAVILLWTASQASLATLGSTFWRTLGAILSNKIYENSIWREPPHVGVAGATS